MADGTIDSLNIQIASDANRAVQALNSLQNKLGGLNSALNGLNIGGLSSFSSGVEQLSHAMSAFKSGEVKTGDFTRIANGLNKLKDVNYQNVSDASRSISALTSNLSELKTISFDSSGIENIASAIAKLGRSSVTEATQNLEFLKTSVAEFVFGMNDIGSLNFGTDSLYKLVSSVSRLGSNNATQSVKNLPLISAYLQDFVTGMNSVKSVTFNFDGLEKLVGNISRLGGAKATQSVKNLEPIKKQLLRFIDGLNGIGALKFDMTGLNELVGAISKLGGKAAGNAIPNIEGLGVALKQLMATLSTAPRVSQNLIDMTNALGNLAKNGSRVSTASRTMQNGLNGFSMSAKSARKNTMSLAAAFGKFYATYWLIIRGIGQLKKAINISSQLTEVQNVVDVTFGKYRNAIEEFSGTSIQDFGISELTSKQVSSRFQAMGVAMGFSQKKMSEMSVELTALAADMASFYNVEQKVVAEDLEAIFTGQTRPLRTYGLDLTQATLQEWALKQGIDAKVQSMSQAEKTLLRYQYVMANTQAAQGDFARTSGTWANQIRILSENFKALGSVVGGVLINAFKPFITTLNKVMSAVLQFAKVVSDALGAIFGWKFQVGGGGVTSDLDDIGSSAGGAADNLGSAADNAKKLQANLQGFDELNVFTSTDDSSGGSGGGGGGGGTTAPESAGQWVEAESLWEKYTSSIDSLYKLGEYIGDTLINAMNNIDWGSVYEGARNFGSGLADFLNGLISPELFGATGRTIAGALNTAIYAALSFGQKFDWTNFALSIATGINEFFSTFDFASLAETVNVWAKGILDTAITALDKTDWDLIGTQIGTFLEKIDFIEIGKKVGKAFWKALNAGIELWKGVFKKAPIETAILSMISLEKLFGTDNIINYGKALVDFSKNVNKALNVFPLLTSAFNGNQGAMLKLSSIYPKLTVAVNKTVIAFDKFKTLITKGNIFKNINTAIGKLRNNLSSVQKGAITAVAGFAEFVIVKDTFSDLILGSENVLGGITKIGVAVGGAAAAMYVALGPTGIAIAAVTGLVAAIMGIDSAMNEIADNDAAEIIANNLSNPGGRSLSEITDEYKNNIGEISSEFDTLKEKSEGIGTAKESIEKTAQSIDTIRFAIENGAYTAEEKIPQIQAIFNQLYTDSKTVLDNEYDLIIEALSGSLGKVMEDAGVCIPEYIELLNSTKTDTEKAYDEIRSSMETLDEQYTNGEISAEAYYAGLDENIKRLGKFSEDTDAFSESIENVSKATNDIDFSKFINADKTLDITAIKDDFSSMATTVNEAKDTINISGDEVIKALEDYQQKAIAVGDSLTASKLGEAIKYQAQSINTASGKVNNELENYGNQIQIQLLERIPSIVDDAVAEWENKDALFKWIHPKEEYVQNAITEYQTGFIDPVVSELDSMYRQAGVDTSVFASDMAKQTADSMFTTTTEYVGKEGRERTVPILRENYKQVYNDALNGMIGEIAPNVRGVSDDVSNELTGSLKSHNKDVKEEASNLLKQIINASREERSSLIQQYNEMGIGIVDEGLIEALASKDDDTQDAAIELIGQIHAASDDERGPLIEKLNGLGIDVAGGLNAGLGSKTTEIRTTSEGNVKAVKEPVENEFKSARSGSMYDYGANASKGFWQGVKDWWDDSWLGKKINEFKIAVSGKKGLDEHSPSKIMRQFGIYAIEGFNIGLSDEMQNTFSALQEWTGNIRSFDIPSFTTEYEINRNVLDSVDVQYRTPELNIQKINSQLDLSLAGDIGELIAETRRQNELLEVIANKPVIDKNDIGGAYISYAKDYRKQTGKQLGISY